MITSAPNSASTETTATAKMMEIAEGGRMAACFERLRGENRAGLVTFITGGRMSLFFRAGRAMDEVAILLHLVENYRITKKTSAIICGRPL